MHSRSGAMYRHLLTYSLIDLAYFSLRDILLTVLCNCVVLFQSLTAALQ